MLLALRSSPVGAFVAAAPEPLTNACAALFLGGDGIKPRKSESADADRVVPA